MIRTLVGIVFCFRKLQKVSGLHILHGQLQGWIVKPSNVADSAFPISLTYMKCYEIRQPAYRCSFNYSLIRMRKIVEKAFGRLKRRWKIMDGKCSLKTQCSSDKWQWCVVPRTCVKDTSAQCWKECWVMRVGWGPTTDEFMHSKMGRWSENAASRTETLEMGTSGVARKTSSASILDLFLLLISLSCYA